MAIRIRTRVAAVIAAGVLGLPAAASAQLDHLPFMLTYSRGQDVQPIFQGWSRNPDGTFEMHFGYLNRNYIEHVHVPVGPANQVEPGDPDQGQPTFFYPRTNRQVFSVTVPADFGDRELIWTLTVRDRTSQAVGWLQAEWEIDPVGGGRTLSEEARANQPPALTVATPAPVRLGATVDLVATVTDDGLPAPRPQRERSGDRPARPPVSAILEAPDGAPEIPTNVPDLDQPRSSRPREGLSVGYIVWRGPAEVAFEPAFAQPEDGTATTTATFSQPGTYVLQASASDGRATTEQFVTVTVE